MTTVTISLPDQIVEKVDLEARKQGFATRSEFVRSLLRRYFVDSRGELEFLPFEKKPLKQIKAEFEKTGKYSKKFVNSVIKGLSGSSVYANKASK